MRHEKQRLLQKKKKKKIRKFIYYLRCYAQDFECSYTYLIQMKIYLRLYIKDRIFEIYWLGRAWITVPIMLFV